MRIGWVVGAFVVAPSIHGENRSQARAYRQPVPGSRVEIPMVAIPSGKLAATDSGTPVEVAAFWISATEIPWDVYDIYAFGLDLTVEESNGSVDAVSRPTKPYGAADRGFGHDGYPALGMTYHAAVGFAAWLTERTGVQYRLPNELEWRLACSALANAAVDTVAWTWDNAFDGPQPVGSKPASPHGAHDLLGNVAEWVTGADGQPQGRGGSFADKAADVGCNWIARQTPAWNARDPQIPKSRWWLSDAPFMGIRLVAEKGPDDD